MASGLGAFEVPELYRHGSAAANDLYARRAMFLPERPSYIMQVDKPNNLVYV